jgi:hypothetical protein
VKNPPPLSGGEDKKQTLFQSQPLPSPSALADPTLLPPPRANPINPHNLVTLQTLHAMRSTLWKQFERESANTSSDFSNSSSSLDGGGHSAVPGSAGPALRGELDGIERELGTLAALCSDAEQSEELELKFLEESQRLAQRLEGLQEQFRAFQRTNAEALPKQQGNVSFQTILKFF